MLFLTSMGMLTPPIQCQSRKDAIPAMAAFVQRILWRPGNRSDIHTGLALFFSSTQHSRGPPVSGS